MSYINVRLRPYWVLAYTQFKRESWAAENIQKQGYEYYLPKCKVLPLQKDVPARPLFPRYIFVRVRGPWRWLLGTKGVSGVVMADDGPARVPRDIIASLQASQNSEGVIELDLSPEEDKLQPDSHVKIDGTVFTGHDGIVERLIGRDRARVLVEFMGAQISITVDKAALRVC